MPEGKEKKLGFKYHSEVTRKHITHESNCQYTNNELLTAHFSVLYNKGEWLKPNL